MFGLFKRSEPAAVPAGTYSFQGTGISFNCRFPSSRFKGRPRSMRRTSASSLPIR